MSCEGEFLVILVTPELDGPAKVRIERADQEIHATTKVLQLTRDGNTVCRLTGGAAPEYDDFTGAVLSVADSYGRAAAYHVVGRCPHGAWMMRDTLVRCPN